MAHETPELPNSIITRRDVGQISRELHDLETTIEKATIQKGESQKALPVSQLLDDLASQNKLNLLKPEDRKSVKDFLEYLHNEAPILHFSFGSDPSPRFMASLISWLRREINPLVLLQVGLEPALGAGCVLRTTNHYFDFSLRQHFNSQRDLLINKLREGRA